MHSSHPSTLAMQGSTLVLNFLLVPTISFPYSTVHNPTYALAIWLSYSTLTFLIFIFQTEAVKSTLNRVVLADYDLPW